MVDFGDRLGRAGKAAEFVEVSNIAIKQAVRAEKAADLSKRGAQIVKMLDTAAQQHHIELSIRGPVFQRTGYCLNPKFTRRSRFFGGRIENCRAQPEAALEF